MVGLLNRYPEYSERFTRQSDSRPESKGCRHNAGNVALSRVIAVLGLSSAIRWHGSGFAISGGAGLAIRSTENRRLLRF
jgi:hypothetical protein